MIGSIMSLASAAVSGAQAINNFQKAKKAEKQAIALGNQMNAMKIKDAYAALQAPDIATAQYNETMRQAAQATQALQGMGPEGAGQIANLNQSILQQNAQTTADQAALNYDRDRAVAEGRNQNAQYEYQANMDIIQSRLTGAQAAATAGKEAGMSSIAGAIEGVGGGIAGLYGESDNIWGKGKTTQTQKAPSELFASKDTFKNTTVPTRMESDMYQQELQKKRQDYFNSQPFYSLGYPQQ